METPSLQRRLVTWGIAAFAIAAIGLAARFRHLDEVPADAINLDEVLRVVQGHDDHGDGVDGLAAAIGLARTTTGQPVYSGPRPLRFALIKDGKLVAYVDANGDGAWDTGIEPEIFSLEVEKARSRLIASDRYGNHRYVDLKNVDEHWLTKDMLRTQIVYYGRPHVFAYYYSPHGYYGSYSWRRTVRAASISHRGRSGGHHFGK